MKHVSLTKPEVNPCFFHGEIVEWNFRQSLVKSHGKYAIRFSVTFADGYTVNKEQGGYDTIKKGQMAKEQLIVDLHNHVFVCFHVTVKEFFDYWLYYYEIDTKKITYNTYIAYRNIIYNYIIPAVGNRKMTSIKRDDLLKLMERFDSKSKLQMAYGVIGSAFKHAKAINIVRNDAALTAIRTKRRLEAKKAANQPENVQKRERVTLDGEQISRLLAECKRSEPEIFLPMIITAVTGCRVSELIAMRFSFVNFENGTIYVHEQLGRTTHDSDMEKGAVGSRHIPTKSEQGVRICLLPDFVMEEMIAARKRYEKEKQNPDFQDSGYIWHQANGRPYGRSAYKAPFNRLKKKLGIPQEFHWHDLRHTFATVMVSNRVSLKEISAAMGHADSDFTWKIYVEKSKVISNEIPELYPWIEEFIMPEVETSCDLVIKNEIIQEMIIA